MRLENELIQIGLSEKEAKIYLAALELGPTNIATLTEKSGIRRSTVYEMIKNLKNRGLLIESIRGKRPIFIAAEPDKLKKTITAKENILNQILPELNSINNLGFTKPKISYYEGREGLREIYLLALEAKDKRADWISPIESIFGTVGQDFLEQYVETKKKMGYWIRSIHIMKRQASNYKYQDPKTFRDTLRDMRFAPPEVDFSNAFGIWDDKVATISTKKEGFGFIVESPEYAASMRIFYELLWNTSLTPEALNKKIKKPAK